MVEEIAVEEGAAGVVAPAVCPVRECGLSELNGCGLGGWWRCTLVKREKKMCTGSGHGEREKHCFFYHSFRPSSNDNNISL